MRLTCLILFAVLRVLLMCSFIMKFESAVMLKFRTEVTNDTSASPM